MQDNNLKIAFDYKYPDTAVLVVYEAWASALWGGDSSIRVRKIITGEEAIKTYSLLSGKDIPSIHREAGYTEYEKEKKYGITVDKNLVTITDL